MKTYKPDGATHYRERLDGSTSWYKQEDGKVYWWWGATSRWVVSPEVSVLHLKRVVSDTGANQ